ncbi:ABC transporter [Mycobacterium sp. Soil538]|nr:ABC transporter [Mycobacterium sp. Soil538]
MGFALSTVLHTSFDDALARTREALAEQGFGVLTEIDMQATLKAKLGEDMEQYVILGACNPPLAHRAVEVDRQIGLLLPCNVVVRADPGTEGDVLVEAMDPQVLVDVSGEAELRPVADEVAAKLRAAIDAL